jgi:prepilin-type N-terminal cleavage/methylation domain-containing protein
MSLHNPTRHTHPRRSAHSASGERRAFTLIEIVLVTVIITVLAALIVVAVGRAIRTSRASADQFFMRSMSVGVERFRSDFNFLPPLVDDSFNGVGGAPLINVGGSRRPKLLNQTAAGAEFPVESPATNSASPTTLNGFYGNVASTTPRFSNLSLSYYLLGTLPRTVDGVDGPGFTRPKADGGFALSGQSFPPLFDFANSTDRLVADNTGVQERTRLVDRYGFPILYMRWEPFFYADNDPNRGLVANFCVPAFVGDSRENSKLRRGGFALVSGGPDGLLSVSDPTDPVNKDNVVEIGQ